MKRTLLLFSLFLCLAWQGAQAQGPFPVPVSAPNAARFIREQPSYAQYFVNGKSGSMTCTDQAALNAFLKFEVANQLPSTLMATAPAGSERPAKNTAGQSAPVTTGPAAVTLLIETV